MTHRPDWFVRLTLAFRRPRFFSKYEWWYHWLVMPVLFPLGNYYFIGPRYFSSLHLFGVGTAVVFCLYWLSVFVLTGTVRWVIRRYPTANQTVVRMGVMLVAVGCLTVGLAVVDVWVYSLIPATGLRFSWAVVRPIWVLGLVFDVFLCITLGLGYTYTQWHKDLQEEERIQQEIIRRQYNTLKGQLNPYFLFNSLNSLVALIKEEPKRAEVFVDKLASVYRYMLQPGRRVDPSTSHEVCELVTLEEELEFMHAYVDLLQISVGTSLQLKWPGQESRLTSVYSLPPLSLQLLLDNAIHTKGLSASKPLYVMIDITDDGWLLMTNNRFLTNHQPEAGQALPEELTSRYNSISEKVIRVDATESGFRVAIPLVLTRDYAAN